MTSDQKILINVFRRYGRHVGNLRPVVQQKYIGVFLGAGVSAPLGIPSWDRLLKVLADDPRIDAKHLLNKQNTVTYSTQMVFHHFRAKRIDERGVRGQPTAQDESTIKAEWREFVHEKLYANKPLKGGFLQTHPYLSSLLNVIRKSAVVVNYNFDNVVEKGLLETRSPGNRERGFRSTWRACIQKQPGLPLIYHPNGFLPENLLEDPSDDLVFTEASFADQLIDSMIGHYASVLHVLSQHTNIFLGLSLSDPTLKHLLRQHVQLSPGHFHYFIAFGVGEQRQRAVTEANFDVYNLVTLFLKNHEIKAFFELLTFPEEELVEIASQAGMPRKHVYYVTGVPGSGKSSIVSSLYSLDLFDQWVEERQPDMVKPYTKLSKAREKKLAHWIADQFALRNYRAAQPKEGIFVLDRCPLDPLAFTKARLRGKKAKLLFDKIVGHSGGVGIVPGQIILLLGEPKQLEKRAESRHKRGKRGYFAKMQEDLDDIYSGKGSIRFSSPPLSVSLLAKGVLYHILFGPYEEFDCGKRLRSYFRIRQNRNNGRKDFQPKQLRLPLPRRAIVLNGRP